jgi:hypothetical protein
MQINLEQMRKKTEIENNLLNQVEENLRNCMDELDGVNKNYSIILNFSEYNLNNQNKFIPINKIFDQIEQIEQKQNTQCSKLYSKLFAHVNQTYWAFQYFYLKKKDFMGMNLTGLVNGKVETGLGFRNCFEKINQNLMYKKYSDLIKLFGTITDKDILQIYKIKSNTFGWEEFGLGNYSYFYIGTNLSTQEYFLAIEHKYSQ